MASSGTPKMDPFWGPRDDADRWCYMLYEHILTSMVCKDMCQYTTPKMDAILGVGHLDPGSGPRIRGWNDFR